MTVHSRVLLVDPDGPDVMSLRHLLAAAGFETVQATSTDAAVEQLHAVDVVLLGLEQAGLPGLTRVANASAGVQTIAMMDAEPGELGREALRLGAFDLVRRAIDADSLLFAVERAVHAGTLLREVTMLRARVGDRVAQSLIGRSSAMASVRDLVGRAAASRMTVLVTGEAGTGKDVVARLVHDLSNRADRPFVSVRCAGADEATLAADLFGDADPDGTSARGGLFARARGGTLVLDEISSLAPPLRGRLAQLVAQRAVQQVGAGELVPVDVRLIVTARQSVVLLPPFSGSGISSRMNVLPIALPPLRERRADIPMLVQHFRARMAADTGMMPLPTLTPETLMGLIAQPWPGNVRELEHFVERSAYQTVTRSSRSPGATSSASFDDEPTLEELERRYILHVLDREQGHQSRAADRLGIDRRTLYRKLKHYRPGGADDGADDGEGAGARTEHRALALALAR
jgi:two-component system response regulator HydG